MTVPAEVLLELKAEAFKAAPPATVLALTLNEWVAVATIAYIVLQAAYLAWKWWRAARAAPEV